MTDASAKILNDIFLIEGGEKPTTLFVCFNSYILQFYMCLEFSSLEEVTKQIQ